ncbi:hypothetical protein ACLOJK_000920 [Asimina triloba]
MDETWLKCILEAAIDLEYRIKNLYNFVKMFSPQKQDQDLLTYSSRSQRNDRCGPRDEGKVEVINDLVVFITGASQGKAVGGRIKGAIYVELVQPLHASVAPFKPTFAVDHMKTEFFQDGRQSFGSHNLKDVDKLPSQTSQMVKLEGHGDGLCKWTTFTRPTSEYSKHQIDYNPGSTHAMSPYSLNTGQKMLVPIDLAA